VKSAAVFMALLSSLTWAAPLSPEAKAIIPAGTGQLISLDYRMLRKFEAAMTLKGQVLPDNLKQFEIALQNISLYPDSDLETLAFGSFDDEKQSRHTVAVASGSFSAMTVLTQLRLHKLSPRKYRDYDLYPLSKKLVLTVLGEGSLLMGDAVGMETVLTFRDNHAPTIDTNKALTEIIKPIEKATVWSVLDRASTQRLLISVLGDDPKVADVARIKEKVLGSYFRMNFRGGIRFDMNVLTADPVTSAGLTSLLKMGILYKKIIANPAQKLALDNVTVASKLVSQDSEKSELQMQFKATDQQLGTLLHSHCFTAISNERKEFSGFSSAVVGNDPKGTEHMSAKPE
jgi:hypothetical protein